MVTCKRCKRDFLQKRSEKLCPTCRSGRSQKRIASRIAEREEEEEFGTIEKIMKHTGHEKVSKVKLLK